MDISKSMSKNTVTVRFVLSNFLFPNFILFCNAFKVWKLLLTKSSYMKETNLIIYAHSFQAMTHVVKQLHSRDTRLHYCPPNHWLSTKVEFQVDLVFTVVLGYPFDNIGYISFTYLQLDPVVRSTNICQDCPN